MHHPRNITPEDAPAAMLATIRQFARAILGDVSDESVVRLTLAQQIRVHCRRVQIL